MNPPAGGLTYPEVLVDAQAPAAVRVVRAVIGMLVGICLYLVLVPLVAAAVTWLGWRGDGRPGTWGAYYPRAMAFEHPWGMLGTNLGLALLTVIALVLVRWWHHRDVRWTASVQPGMRWRYLVLCLPAALAVLGGVQAMGALSGAGGPQPRLWLWLLLVLVSSPLQAAGEEFFFRGYLLQAFGSMVGAGRSPRLAQAVAVLASSLLFALFHGVQNPALFVDRLGFGLLAGALVVATGGLEAGIACHVVNNLMAFGWAALHGGIAEARALQSIGWTQALVDVAGFALFAVVALLLARPLRLATTTPQALPAGGREALPRPDLASRQNTR